MRDGLDRLRVRGIGVKPNPLNTERAGSKSGHVNVEVWHVNLVRTRDLSGNSDVMIAPAMPGDRRWRLVVLSQMLIQNGTSLWF